MNTRDEPIEGIMATQWALWSVLLIVSILLEVFTQFSLGQWLFAVFTPWEWSGAGTAFIVVAVLSVISTLSPIDEEEVMWGRAFKALFCGK